GTACDDGMSCTGGDQCVSGKCEGVSLTCGNGVVECGEECDDGNVLPNDGCSPTCHFSEICGDLIDNDNDGKADCADPHCAATCHPLVSGGIPSRASRITVRHGLDQVRLFGSMLPTTSFDPATESFGLGISDANGVLFSAILPPGSFGVVGSGRWV